MLRKRESYRESPTTNFQTLMTWVNEVIVFSIYHIF